MAPQLGVQSDTKVNNLDADSNSSGSEEADSSSDEDSSDSDMESEDLFVNLSTTTAVDHPRNPLSVMFTADHPTETMANVNSVTNSVANTAPAVVNRPPTSVKRLRNMFAAVKTPDSSVNTTINATAMQPLCSEAVTPVSSIATAYDVKNIVSVQQAHATVTATTIKSETKDTSSVLQLPRKSNSKRILSISSKLDSKKSVLSEESSSDSEGEESGEVTNSDSEDEATKPKPSKKAKWDNTPAVVTSETAKLQLVCSIPKQYVRTMPTPVTTPKSPVSLYMYHYNNN